MSPRFPCVTLGIKELPLSLFASKGCNLSVCVVFVDIKPMVVGFILLEVDICGIWTVSGK